MPIELKTKNGGIQLTAPKTGGGSVDLSNYYTKTQTDEKINEAIETIPKVDLSGYATETYVTESLSGLASESYVDNATSQFVTEAQVDTKIANIDIPEVDLEPYALKTEIPDVSGYQTATQVETAINNALNAIGVAEEGAY